MQLATGPRRRRLVPAVLPVLLAALSAPAQAQDSRPAATDAAALGDTGLTMRLPPDFAPAKPADGTRAKASRPDPLAILLIVDGPGLLPVGEHATRMRDEIRDAFGTGYSKLEVTGTGTLDVGGMAAPWLVADVVTKTSQAPLQMLLALVPTTPGYWAHFTLPPATTKDEVQAILACVATVRRVAPDTRRAGIRRDRARLHADHLGFSCELPPQWDAVMPDDKEQGFLVASGPTHKGFTANLNAGVDDAQVAWDVARMKQDGVPALQAGLKDFKLQDVVPFKVDGKSGVRLRGSYELASVGRVHLEQFLVHHERRMFTLTFSAHSGVAGTLSAAFEKSAGSMRLVRPPVAGASGGKAK